MGHGGSTRLYQAISQFFFSPRLKARVEELVSTCDSCQRNKNIGPGYGHLPPRNDVSVPWEEIAIDLIGPWTIQIPYVGELQISALTAIDTATGLAELTRIDNKTAPHIALKLEHMWLSRYPRPLRVIHDQGGEFVGAKFQMQLHALDIEPVPTTVKNPQANSICERMHKTCGDQIRTLIRERPPHTVETALELVDTVLAAAQRALRITINRTVGMSPGALAFGRDMLLPIPVLTDFNLIRERRQTIIDDNNRRVNLRRRFHDYKMGDKVLLITYDPTKLEDRATGPYVIVEVHVNGTVTIERAPGVLERINIRRVRPYRERPT
jgi:transposase InsO family protein